jgi:hypothetical protein
MGKGGNKAREGAKDDSSRRSEDTAAQNERDEAVARDPDIGGVTVRGASTDPHARGRQA